MQDILNLLSANLSTNCLSVFDHFVGLALKGLNFPKGPRGPPWCSDAFNDIKLVWSES